MIDVSELMSDPELAQAVSIKRFTGQFVDGVYQLNTPTTILATGIVTPTSTDDAVSFLPEGERQKNNKSIWSATTMQMADGAGSLSDELLIDGEYFRVAYISPWKSFGYQKVIATGFVP